MSGENGIFARAPTWDVQWSIGVASPCFALVTWNLTQALLRFDLEEEEGSSVFFVARSLLPAHGLQFVVEAATTCLE